jgi:hypothetical protein
VKAEKPKKVVTVSHMDAFDRALEAYFARM